MITVILLYFTEKILVRTRPALFAQDSEGVLCESLVRVLYGYFVSLVRQVLCGVLCEGLYFFLSDVRGVRSGSFVPPWAWLSGQVRARDFQSLVRGLVGSLVRALYELF